MTSVDSFAEMHSSLTLIRVLGVAEQDGAPTELSSRGEWEGDLISGMKKDQAEQWIRALLGTPFP